MKYFTRERWRAAQRPDDAVREEWRVASEEYESQLKTVEAKLSPDARRFFRADVHDGELLHFNIIDGGRIAAGPAEPWEYQKQFPVSVELEVLESTGERSWKLRYLSCRRTVVDFPSDDPLFHTDGHGFGDWGYHELTDVGGGFFRHEVLFSSGSTLLIEFTELQVQTQPLSNVPAA
jgi:hypothetical protein